MGQLELGLIDADLWERRRIGNERICRAAHEYAESVAGQQMKAWKANRSKSRETA